MSYHMTFHHNVSCHVTLHWFHQTECNLMLWYVLSFQGVSLLASIKEHTHTHTHTSTHTHTHTHIYMYTHSFTHTNTHTHTHSLTYTHTYIHTHTHKYIHTHTFTHTHTHIHTYTHTRIFIYAHTFTHTHTYIHTHTHTHTHKHFVSISSISSHNVDRCDSSHNDNGIFDRNHPHSYGIIRFRILVFMKSVWYCFRFSPFISVKNDNGINFHSAS
jgi:hypothetical protein